MARSRESLSGWARQKRLAVPAHFDHADNTGCFMFFFQAEDGIRDLQGDWSSDVCSSDLCVGAICSQPWRSAIRRCSKASPSDRKSTRLNSSHLVISYAVFCLKKKNRI